MLIPSDNQSGYKNVTLSGGKKPYTVTYTGGPKPRKGGKAKQTETFATAEEAALAYARHVGAEAAREQAAKAAESKENKRMKI